MISSLPVEMAGMGLTMNPFLLQNLNQILAGGMGGPLAGMLGSMGGMGGMQQGWAGQGAPLANMWGGEQQKVGIVHCCYSGLKFYHISFVSKCFDEMSDISVISCKCLNPSSIVIVNVLICN